MSTLVNHVVISTGVARGPKSLRPRRGLDHFGALWFRVKAAKEIGGRHVVLGLNIAGCIHEDRLWLF